MATFPWSFYAVSITLDYQTLRLIRGRNERVDLVAAQLETAIGSLADVCGTDLTGTTKSIATPNAFSALGIVEATDDGTAANNYGNITRTGAGSFANWPGQNVRKLTTGNIGNAANDAPIALFYNVYNLCTQGFQVPRYAFTTKQGVAAYMFSLQAQQRLSPGDIANVGYAGAKLFGSDMVADDHIINPTNGSNIGCNFYLVNPNHTKFFYFDRKGVDFVNWVDIPNAVGRVSRYVAAFQYASSQPRTGGALFNVNSVANL